MGAVGVDFNDDGRVDVFVANDMSENHLWLNQGNWRFEERAAQWGVSLDTDGVANAGMGVAAEDVDSDGDFDILVVNLKGQTDSYFLNAGSWFVAVTDDAELQMTSSKFTRFGVAPR